ncbi:aminotransferase class IV [Actinoplanes sp. NPDC049599]|uniref:aminotransferase class IV n=1 Tax=Actinoplanes sp. NPDC049599 TaxID=3363903 RepID=UPI00378F1B73
MLNVELNGRTPDLAQLHRIATLNYGHYTSFQVRDQRVRGLALHLSRLADGAEELFGHRIGVAEEHRLLGLIRHALGPVRDASVRVTFVPGSAEPAPPDVLVSVSDPAPDEPGPPLRVQTVRYERELPEHKHQATMGLNYRIRQARLAGFDDALCLGLDGRVREGTSWNVAFWDGDRVVWPAAPMLKGVTMVLLQLAMTMNGIRWDLRPVDADELSGFAAAAAVNSRWPARALASIDELPLKDDGLMSGTLREAWATVPWDEL